MKKLLIFLMIAAVNIPLFAASMQISYFPFSVSSGVSEVQGEFIAHSIISKLRFKGYKFVDRSDDLGRAISREREAASIGAREYASIANQFNLAGYVMTGQIIETSYGYNISVRVIELDTSLVVATSTGSVPNLAIKGATTLVIEDIAGELDSQIRGKRYISAEERYRKGYYSANTAAWVGRGFYTVGFIAAITPFIIEYFKLNESGQYKFGTFLTSDPTGIESIVFYSGVGLFAMGLLMETVGSAMKSSYASKLRDAGINYAFYPIINPINNNKIDYGMQFAISYSF